MVYTKPSFITYISLGPHFLGPGTARHFKPPPKHILLLLLLQVPNMSTKLSRSTSKVKSSPGMSSGPGRGYMP